MKKYSLNAYLKSSKLGAKKDMNAFKKNFSCILKLICLYWKV